MKSPNKETCIECNHPVVVKGYPNALCESCRESFIKYPIPKWIKVFAACIALLLLFSLYKLPENILTGMHLEKGKTAIEEKKFLTAQKELEKVDLSIPDNQETESYLLLAAYHNQDIPTVIKMFEKLKDKNFDDQDLFNKVEDKINQAQYFFPDDNFNEMIQKNDSDISKIPIDSIKSFTTKFPESIYALQYYASVLADKEDYALCDSILQQILRLNSEYYPALELMTSVKRQENQLKESITYCDQILKANSESAFAIASKARTFLKQKRDKEALELALKSIYLDESNPYATGSLLLAYHFNNKQKEKENLLKKIASIQDTVYAQTLQYVQDVVSGKESFRN
ncbi:MAG TPA: hypothetical protein VLR49_10260 [Ferruginibacter sp.]|nr:hypothetical protein [Ferruginibacter sp.]